METGLKCGYCDGKMEYNDNDEIDNYIKIQGVSYIICHNCDNMVYESMITAAIVSGEVEIDDVSLLTDEVKRNLNIER